MRLLSIGATALVLIGTPHEMFHAGYYENWLTATGGSCCNDSDCHGADGWRYGIDGYQVFDGGRWLDVPPEAVRPYASPDMNAHVCIWNGKILCFVPGGGV